MFFHVMQFISHFIQEKYLLYYIQLEMLLVRGHWNNCMVCIWIYFPASSVPRDKKRICSLRVIINGDIITVINIQRN